MHRLPPCWMICNHLNKTHVSTRKRAFESLSILVTTTRWSVKVRKTAAETKYNIKKFWIKRIKRTHFLRRLSALRLDTTSRPHIVFGAGQNLHSHFLTVFLKPHFQSERPVIDTLSSLSWHWFYSQEEEEMEGDGRTEELMEGGRSAGGRDAAAELHPLCQTVGKKISLDVSYVMDPF